VGCSRAGANLATAISRGHVDVAETDLATAARHCDLLVVCTPVDRIVEDIRVAAGACRTGSLITDTGSVKASVCAPLSSGIPSGVTFIGSHPIAGSEKQGCAHASSDLFENRVCVLTPASLTPRFEVERLTAFWQSLGLDVVEMSAEVHDRALAQTSHVPHVVAAALAASLAAENRHLTAGGFHDTTRIAGGDPDLWTAILMSNADQVADGVRSFSERLAAILRALETRDKQTLTALLRSAKESRDAANGASAPPTARPKSAGRQ
jgi:prephenate dehydrogenase